jgi:D-lactate dehydrogenase
MHVAFFSTKPYDRRFFTAANTAHRHAITFLEPRLTPETARLAHGHDAVCAFVNDQLPAAVLETLHAGGTRLIALRSAGFNHVDLAETSAIPQDRLQEVKTIGNHIEDI